MTESRALWVFARAPEAGRVKTRLIPRVGEAGAAELHAAFLDDVCALVRDVAELRLLGAAGDVDHPHLVALAERDAMALVPQATGDLGARMAHAIREGLVLAERVCIVGSDSPALAPAMVARAFDLLADADVVLGPADDGGYWLVGARRPCEAIFEDVAWGTSSVLATTLERARAAGLDVALADPFWDVDEPRDLDRLAAALAADPALAPASRAALARLVLRSAP